MRKLVFRLDKYFPLFLSLALFSAFLSAKQNDEISYDLEVAPGVADQAWVWAEVEAEPAVADTLKYSRTESLAEETAEIRQSLAELLEPMQADSGSILVGYQANLSKEYPVFVESLLAKKGKASSVDLGDKFKKVLARDSKLKSPGLKKLSIAKANGKKSVKSAAKNKTVSKYSVYSAKSKWQPGSRSLARVYNKVYKSGKLSRTAITRAFKYYEKYKSRKGLSNKYLVVADYTKAAKKKRMHLINLKNGRVASYFVAHGKRSGPVGGRVYRTSNRRNSHMTSRGFFKVGYKEGRTIKKGYRYLSVTGLERGNRKVGLPSRLGGRDVVIHTARYVNKGGRSFGCFSIRPQDRARIFGKIKGALLYSYAG